MSNIVESSWFTARGIMTEIDPRNKDSCCHIVIDESDCVLTRTPDEKLSNIDNLVVFKQDKIIGYVPKSEVIGKPSNIILEETKIKDRDDISADSPMYEVAERLSKKVDDNLYHLLFVTDKNQRIIGLVNQADLNRWSCYIYSYLILLYVEKEAFDYIISACASDSTIKDSLLKLNLSDKAKTKLQKEKTLEEALKNFYIGDLLITVGYINERQRSATGSQVVDHLELISRNVFGNIKFRNVVAHTVRRIFDKTYNSMALKNLADIWEKFWEKITSIDQNHLNTSGHSLSKQ